VAGPSLETLVVPTVLMHRRPFIVASTTQWATSIGWKISTLHKLFSGILSPYWVVLGSPTAVPTPWLIVVWVIL